MSSLWLRIGVFLCLTVLAPSGFRGMYGQTPSTPTAPQEPIDPNSTAGPRGPGYAVKVQVQFNRKPVDGASVLAKNPDGTVADSCNTDSTGACRVSVGAGSYTFTAAQNGLAGSATGRVGADTKQIAVKLTKVKPEPK
jgi:hypothetical protein